MTTPNLVGLSWYNASFLIVQQGLVQTNPPRVVSQKGTNPGTVVAQSPAAGTVVGSGTEIQLTVSSGNSLLSVTFDLFQFQFGQML